MILLLILWQYLMATGKATTVDPDIPSRYMKPQDDCIFFPINLRNVHWVLQCTKIDNGVWCLYDSKPSKAAI